MPLVDYLIARDGLPSPRGMAYDYLVGGDGLFVAARNRFLDVRVPIAPAAVRGLPPLYAALTLRRGRLPESLWDQILGFARDASEFHRELYLAVTWDDDGGYRLVLPHQRPRADRVIYRPVPDTVLAIHSHHVLPAFFSVTDDADEQGLGLYGVLGRLDRDRPEVALRVGIYGYRMPVPWEDVFAGERGRVPFGPRDVFVDPPEEGAERDDLSD